MTSEFTPLGFPGTSFLTILFIALPTVICLFLSIAYFFEFLNHSHPDRKVQKSRLNKIKEIELRKTLGSIFTVALCISTGIYAQLQGWALTPVSLTWWSAPVFFIVSVFLYDTWNYWTHRLLHTKFFYKFHAPHHRSLSPTVWSNHNESLTEAFFNQSFFMVVPFILPIPWQILVAHKVYDQFVGMLGHAGYEHFASPLSRRPFPLTSTTFHDQHHSSFSFNYGHTFSLWDRVMGTIHPTYDEKISEFEK